MDDLLRDLQNCADEHSQLKQADIKTTATKKRVKALNKRIQLIKDKLPAKLPQVLLKTVAQRKQKSISLQKSPPLPSLTSISPTR